jgi:thioredoxin 1
MKKNIIIAVVFVLAVLGVGIIIKLSQGSTPIDSSQSATQEAENPASHIGEGEIKLTKDNFDAEITNAKGVAVVDMYLPTCVHCQKMGPIFSEIAKEDKDKYKFGKIDMQANPEIGTKFSIESVPAFIFFKDGKEAGRLIGEQSKDAIVNKLQEISK